MTLAKVLDECYMFCGLCILMHVNLKHDFACSATISSTGCRAIL